MLRLTRRSTLVLAGSWAAFTTRRGFAQQKSADAPFINSFGPVGKADDTATFNLALGSGKPFRLRAQNYRLAGPVAVRNLPVTMQGTPGATRLICSGLAKGEWFRIETTAAIDIDGIIWDGNGAQTGSGVGMVAILGAPSDCAIRRCAFNHGSGSAGLLVSVSTDGADRSKVVLDTIEAMGNAGNGVWLEHGVNVVMSALRLHANKGAGLACVRFSNRIGSPLRRITVRDSSAWENGKSGFQIGDYNEAPPGQPVVPGPNNPEVVDATLASLTSYNNTGYGIFADATNIRVTGCKTHHNGELGGIDANARRCVIENCDVSDERAFGIDTGGASEVTITRCRIANIHGVGINPGGSLNITGSDNHISGCTGPAISIWNTEYGAAGWLQYQMNHFRFTNTTIDMSAQAGRFAIEVRDGARDINFDGLSFISTAIGARSPPGPDRALYAATDAIGVTGVRFNGSDRFDVRPVGGVLTVPDIAEAVVLPASNQTLTRVQTTTSAAIGSGIGWITVSDGGRGYDPKTTTATLEGDGDVGAVGKLVPGIWTGAGGRLVGFRIPSPGRGFTRATVQLAGPGAGAKLAVQIGVPIPTKRQLRLVCPGGARFGGELPALMVAPNGTVDLIEVNGKWRLNEHR